MRTLLVTLLAIAVQACASASEIRDTPAEPPVVTSSGITLEQHQELSRIVSRASMSEHIPGTDYFLSWKDSVYVEGESPQSGQTVYYAYWTAVDGQECPRSEDAYQLGSKERKPVLEVLFPHMTVGSVFKVGLKAGVGAGLLGKCGPVSDHQNLDATVKVLEIK